MFHTMSNKTIKIQIIHAKTSFEIKISPDIMLEDFKYQIEKHENINMLYYYLFFDNINLVDTYNKYTIRKVIEMSSKEHKINTDNYEIIVYLLNREDYREVVNKINILSCETHIFNKAYLYCNTCERLICDKCSLTEHKTHKHIIDQALFLDTYFIKLMHIETKFINLFSETKLINYQKVVNDMHTNLSDYINRERNEVIRLSEELKRYVDMLRELEIQRIDKLSRMAEKKINEIQSEAQLVFKIYNNCQDHLSQRDIEIESFSKIANEKKIEYLKDIQKKNADLIANTSRIEKIIEKFRNVRDNDVYKLLELNKDYSYFINLAKIKQIFLKKIKKLESRSASENCAVIFDRMETLKNKSSSSFIYNRLLNLSQVEKVLELVEIEYQKDKEVEKIKENEVHENMSENSDISEDSVHERKSKSTEINTVSKLKLLQPVDCTFTVNVLEVKTMKLYPKDVKFVNSKFEVNIFPKFCRSINVNSNMYVTGGELHDSLVNFLIEVDTQTLEARHLKGMHQRRSAHTMVNLCNEKLIVISGAYSEQSCEQYFIAYDRWEPLPKVCFPRIGACALVYNSESIYLFFGKSYDTDARKWNFLDSIERLKMFTPYPVWEELHFKAKNSDVVRSIAFASIISCPNEKLYILGGHSPNGPNLEYCDVVLEVEMEKELIGVSDLPLPKHTLFLDSNFYFYNYNAINFDNEGTGMIYSVVYNDMWVV